MLLADAPDANLDAAGFADFADGVLGVADEIQEDLNELVGVADDRLAGRLRLEVDLMLLRRRECSCSWSVRSMRLLTSSGFFLRRGGTREFEKILDDARGAAGLAMRQIELALGGFVEACAFAQQFGDAQDGGERIVELVGDAGEHLAHGGEFFGLDELLFQALQVGDVAAGNDDAIDLAGFVEERAEMAADAAPFAVFVADANFERSEGLAAGEDFGEESLERRAVFDMGAFAELAP